MSCNELLYINNFQAVFFKLILKSSFFSGFYRGITPGVTGSLATGATYFGVIESTKQWIEEVNPNLSGHWSHFIAGAIGKAQTWGVYSSQLWTSSSNMSCEFICLTSY